VSDRASTPDELASILERFRLEPAGDRQPSEITEAQLQLLLARIAAVTDTVRALESHETRRIASRILLDDLTVVAAQFRGRANAIAASLATAIAEMREALERCERSSARRRFPRS